MHFAEKWSELNSAYESLDQDPTLAISEFPKFISRLMASAGIEGESREIDPIEAQSLMAAGDSLMAYCNDLLCRIGGKLTDARTTYAAARASRLNGTPGTPGFLTICKHAADREQRLDADLTVVKFKHEAMCLEEAKAYLQRMFEVLTESKYDARAIYTRAQREMKGLTGHSDPLG